MPTPQRPSFADASEIDDFVTTLGRFERGELDADAWRAYRVVRGAYSQRQDGVHMLRIKLPQGLVDAAQLRALAEVAARWSRGFGHVTTRQNFQVHHVRPADLEAAMRRLAAAGITTHGAGGNAVRNVVACPLAGVAEGEPFDVTPYAEAVARHFLRHPLASALPRKLKIAFEGCPEDHAGTSIQDLGFRARVREVGGATARGFAVTVAGGTASLCTSGAPLVEFLPAADVLALAEAVVRVFHARGDRVNKQRNRLKYLVRQLGLDAFRALLDAELARVRAEGAPRLPFDPDRAPEPSPTRISSSPLASAGGEAGRGGQPGPADPVHLAPPSPDELAARVRAAPPRGPGEPPAVEPVLDPTPAALAAFRATSVRPQRQPGYAVVTVSLPQGDVTSAQLEALADLAVAYGEGGVRFTGAGNALLRFVREEDVPALLGRLAAAGLGRAGAGTAAEVNSCPGSELCRLAVTASRGVARAVEAHLRASADLAALPAPFLVRASGCPNGCSQHHVAAIGLQGSARRLGARVVPQYFVLVGGATTGDAARFGQLAAKVPARRVPEAVERLVALYRAERAEGEDAAAFLARSVERARAVLAPLEALSLEDARAEDFREPGATEDFRPATQEGECAA